MAWLTPARAAISAGVVSATPFWSCTCNVASDGRAAQALIDKAPQRYAGVVCDLRMPELDGPGLFRWMAVHHPRLAQRMVFVTGDALGPVAVRFLAESGRPVLEKPFTPTEVVHIVDVMLGRNAPETSETTSPPHDILRKQ